MEILLSLRMCRSNYLTTDGELLTDPNKIVCNFTNALFFWAIQPETAKRPLEEMNYLFTNAPIFIPTMVSFPHRVLV